ncbi:MAG: hypothetical protein R3343_07070 [Nitriliruptorales bacterium]|nr:hypothetical protein [Nitriliruptorales bacterium]
MVDLLLDEVVLCAGPYCGEPILLVTEHREHHDRQLGHGIHAVEGVDPATVRQVQVEEHEIERPVAEFLQGASERRRGGDREADLALGERDTHESLVAGVVLDQEDVDRRNVLTHASRLPLWSPRRATQGNREANASPRGGLPTPAATIGPRTSRSRLRSAPVCMSTSPSHSVGFEATISSEGCGPARIWDGSPRRLS